MTFITSREVNKDFMSGEATNDNEFTIDKKLLLLFCCLLFFLFFFLFFFFVVVVFYTKVLQLIKHFLIVLVTSQATSC